MKHKYMIHASLALIFALTAPQFIANAQTVNPVQSRTAQSAPMNAAADTVTVYGQVLNPSAFKFQVSDYTWNDLKHLMPQLLPDADTKSLSATQVCDLFNEMNQKYLIDVEKSTGDLIYKMETVVSNGHLQPPADLALTDRLASADQKDLDVLIQLMPAERTNIMQAKDATVKSLAMILLYDAALANCPKYAKDKGYFPIY